MHIRCCQGNIAKGRYFENTNQLCIKNTHTYISIFLVKTYIRNILSPSETTTIGWKEWIKESTTVIEVRT
ncbi:MAG: hypothetical protein IPP25_20255 [Saprospiraceae bacterium]|nr:hypothetical protein [Candidatus Opimibacter skivensis]